MGDDEVPPQQPVSLCTIGSFSAGNVLGVGSQNMRQQVLTHTLHTFVCLLQVWYTAVSSADGRSGSISSSIKAHAGDAAGKLRIAAVHILGVPAAEGAALPAANINGRPLAVAFDDVAGVLKITDIELSVGEPLDITWTLGSFSG
jgi:hypothetical protein